MLAVAQLPPLHRDPFDRLLLAQAESEGLLLITADALVARYPGRCAIRAASEGPRAPLPARLVASAAAGRQGLHPLQRQAAKTEQADKCAWRPVIHSCRSWF